MQAPPASAGTSRWYRHRWPWIAVALLGGHATLICVAVTLAVGRVGQTGVQPDYYQRAVAWDDRQAALRASEALGWSVACDTTLGNTDAPGDLIVTLHDADGAPLTGATIDVDLYHAVRTDRRTASAPIPTDTPGEYRAHPTLQTPGLWRVEIRVTHGEYVWVGEFTQQLGAAAPAQGS